MDAQAGSQNAECKIPTGYGERERGGGADEGIAYCHVLRSKKSLA